MDQSVKVTSEAYGFQFKGISHGRPWFNLGKYRLAIEAFKRDLDETLFPSEACNYAELFEAMRNQERLWAIVQVLGKEAADLFVEELQLAMQPSEVSPSENDFGYEEL